MAMHNNDGANMNRVTAADPDVAVTKIIIDIQHATQGDYVPDDAMLTSWASLAIRSMLAAHDIENETELTIRIASENEITELNRQYRHKNEATNVLSFPYEPIAGVNIPLLGDIVICADVVNREADEQIKSRADHWAHIVIHGVLHLLGCDHIEDNDADKMEALEIKILKSLDITNPYQVIDNE